MDDSFNGRGYYIKEKVIHRSTWSPRQMKAATTNGALDTSLLPGFKDDLNSRRSLYAWGYFRRGLKWVAPVGLLDETTWFDVESLRGVYFSGPLNEVRGRFGLPDCWSDSFAASQLKPHFMVRAGWVSPR